MPRTAAGKSVRSKRPTAVDLFCGAGGLSQGLRQAGFDVMAAIDIDELRVDSYRLNHHAVDAFTADLTAYGPVDLARRLGLRRGELDLCAGCPPCQGFSTLRTLNGAYEITDARNRLVLQFAEFVEVLLPKAVMLENVPALAKNRLFADLRRRLTKAGYPQEWQRWEVLDAAEYGVPQRRRRLVYLASRVGPVRFGRRATSRPTVRDAIGGLAAAGASGDALHDLSERRSSVVRKLIRSVPKDGGSRSSLGPNRQLACHQRVPGFYDVYGRMAWDAVAPTITTGCVNPSKGRFLHPDENRAITIAGSAPPSGLHPELPAVPHPRQIRRGCDGR